MASTDVEEGSDYRTMHEIVLEKVRGMILSGKLPAGARIRQDEVAGWLGMSKMPVRDALHRLEAEGLVVYAPHRGATVAKFSPDEIAEVYGIRIALERLAASLGAKNMDGETLERLHSLQSRMETLNWAKEPELWLDLNREFHDTLYLRSGYPRLRKMITGLWRISDHYRRAYLSMPGRQEVGLAEHREIIGACEQRDARMAAQATTRHLRQTLSALTRSLQEVPPVPSPAPR